MEKFYHTQQSVEQYVKMAEGYDGKELIEKLKEFLPAGSSLLELGIGPGTDLELLKNEYRVTGSDFSEVFLNRYRKKYPNADLLILDAVTLETDRKFDSIFSNKVLHHLTDEELETSVLNQLRMLSDRGIVCHSFWRGEKTEMMKGILFNYHSLEKIRELFSKNFKIFLLEVYTELEKDDSILLVAMKKP